MRAGGFDFYSENPPFAFGSRPPYQGVSVKDLLYLDGYGFYVWGSYFVTFALLAIELVVLRKRTQRK